MSSTHLNTSEVVKYYDGKSIFLTGSTGFIGKLILERILRTCVNVKKIYLLVRSKKGKQVEERFEDLFDGPNMERMKSTTPNYREKVVLINGDLRLPECGMSSESIGILQNNVNLIIHCAATVRFDQTIKLATYINVRATRDLVEIARKMKNLEVFLYVSTAYSFLTRHMIDEKIYPVPIKYDKLINLVDTLDDELLNEITENLIRDWPNTYSFTKAVAEGFLGEQCQDLPLVVLRPAIVTATAEEPMPGWIDNIYGPTAGVIAGGLGFLHVVKLDISIRMNIVPADFVVNAIIVAISKKGSEKTKSSNECNGLAIHQNIRIYNICSTKNTLTIRNFHEQIGSIGKKKYGSIRSIWYPSLIFCTTKMTFQILHFFLHVLPACLADLVLLCMQKKPIARELLGNGMKIMKVLDYFTTREWDFKCENTNSLWRNMSMCDRELFNFDIENINWESYLDDYLKGTILYMIKDPIETFPEGRKKMKRLRLLHYTVCGLFTAFAIMFFMYIIKLLIDFVNESK